MGDTWVVDSTPVECARSRDTVRWSELAGWAADGYCKSHSRFFWGLRLHLIRTPAGLPVTWALANPKAANASPNSRAGPRSCGTALHDGPDLLIIANKGYTSCELDEFLAQRGGELLRPSCRNRSPLPGEHLLKPVRQRQLIESANDPQKGQLGLERHD